jgi:hypothetical protein
MVRITATNPESSYRLYIPSDLPKCYDALGLTRHHPNWRDLGQIQVLGNNSQNKFPVTAVTVWRSEKEAVPLTVKKPVSLSQFSHNTLYTPCTMSSITTTTRVVKRNAHLQVNII